MANPTADEQQIISPRQLFITAKKNSTNAFFMLINMRMKIE